jgi:hypothetical protein
MAIDIFVFEGSLFALLIVAALAIVVLAVFRFLIPLIIFGIIAVVLLILIFGGIPIPNFG